MVPLGPHLVPLVPPFGPHLVPLVPPLVPPFGPHFGPLPKHWEGVHLLGHFWTKIRLFAQNWPLPAPFPKIPPRFCAEFRRGSARALPGLPKIDQILSFWERGPLVLGSLLGGLFGVVVDSLVGSSCLLGNNNHKRRLRRRGAKRPLCGCCCRGGSCCRRRCRRDHQVSKLPSTRLPKGRGHTS